MRLVVKRTFLEVECADRAAPGASRDRAVTDTLIGYPWRLKQQSTKDQLREDESDGTTTAACSNIISASEACASEAAEKLRWAGRRTAQFTADHADERTSKLMYTRLPH